MPDRATSQRTFVARHATPRIRRALSDTRIVALVGPRQSGKTTLARRIAELDDRPFITLDDDQHRRFAAEDPIGFMRGLDAAVIDEIQRVPDLILALKKAVDDDPRPGRFLITGSVELFKGATSPDSLAGRVETVELLPFSQAEVDRSGPSGFVERTFAADFAAIDSVGPTRDLVNRVLSGGYPEAVSRQVETRRRAWLRAYARALAERDVAEIATIGKPAEMTRLLDHAALAASQLLNLAKLGSRLGVDGKTVDRWLLLMEHMFLVRRNPAWHRSDLKRLVKAPKLAFLDSALLAALRRVGTAEVASDRQLLGPLLECFVYAELAKAIALLDDAPTICHYRDKDQVEVDLVLAHPSGEVAGIEVKAGATVRPDDFRGLRRLKDAAQGHFACGIVLHDGDRVQRVENRMFAMPVEMLWKA